MKTKDEIIKKAGCHSMPFGEGDKVVWFPNTEIAMDLWAAQKVAERNEEIEKQLRKALESSKTNGHYAEGAMSPRNSVHHAISNIIGLFLSNL